MKKRLKVKELYVNLLYLQAKVDLWKQQCLDLDVVVKEGHLMLQQQSSGQAVAFDEKLGNLNVEWHAVIQVGKRKS